MKADSKHLIILIAITIAASGCASTTQTDTDTTSSVSPIQINSFEAIPNPATSSRTVGISMELENTGDSDADRVSARLFGPTFARQGDDDLAWRLPGDDEDERVVNDEDRIMRFNNLRAPGENTPAVPRRQRISLMSPNLSQGREVDYTFNARILYGYQTTATTDFKFVSGERFQSENMQRTEADVESSSGPIQIGIRGTTPKVFYESDDGEANSEICIQVTNEGEGTAFLGGNTGNDENEAYNLDRDDYEENTVDISIQNVSNIEFEATDGAGNTAEIELVGGDEGFQCFTMTARNLVDTEEQNVNTQITASYNYMKETQTTVTVEGRNNGGTNTGGNGEDGDETPGTPGDVGTPDEN